VLSLVLGVGTWVLFLIPALSRWSGNLPGQLVGLVAALVGLIAGSLLPQWLPEQRGHTHRLAPKSGDRERAA
jgi:hypothetical protein